MYKLCNSGLLFTNINYMHNSLNKIFYLVDSSRVGQNEYNFEISSIFPLSFYVGIAWFIVKKSSKVLFLSSMKDREESHNNQDLAHCHIVIYYVVLLLCNVVRPLKVIILWNNYLLSFLVLCTFPYTYHYKFGLTIGIIPIILP